MLRPLVFVNFVFIIKCRHALHINEDQNDERNNDLLGKPKAQLKAEKVN